MAGSRLRTKSLWQKAVSQASSQARDSSPSGVVGPGNNATGGVMFSHKAASFQKIAANLLETKRMLEKEKEIKAKDEELDELKIKYSKEQDDKKKLQRQLEDLSFSQSDSSRKLARAQEAADKLRLENKKMVERSEQLERNISHMEDRMRNLEIRASEVEKAELTLESTKRSLEACQQDVKIRDRELARAQEKHDEVCKQLESSNTKVQELEKKIEDLKLQVRYELMKNENIEKDLETIPRLKSDKEDQNKKIDGLEKELEERSALLNASRRSAREYKDRLRDLERREEEALSLRDDLDLAKNEVNTLKRLMSSKDVLVQQKCHSLDQAKLAVVSLQVSSTSDDEEVKMKKIQHVLDQLKQLYLQSLEQDGREGSKEKPALHNRFAQSRPRSAMRDRNIDVNQHPYGIDNGHNKENNGDIQGDITEEDTGNKKQPTYIFLERFLNDTEKVDTPPKRHARTTTIRHSGRGHRGTVVQRSQSFHNGSPRSEQHSLRSQTKAVSTHNLSNGPHGRPYTSSSSPRTRNTTTMYMNASGARGSAGNVYTSENGHKLSYKYQPSLDYALGVSTDDELTTDTSHCLSIRQRSTSPPAHRRTHSPTGNAAHSRPTSSYLVTNRALAHSTTGSDTETNSHDGIAEIISSKLTDQQLASLASLSASHRDAILCDAIQNGDRVSITVTQKPPRYGRKKPKPITYTGIVKYKGHLDKDHYDPRIYVGLRLDAPMGESDGTYRGKRYMYTPPDQAKFFKIRDLDSVLDIQSGMYIPTAKLIVHHQETRQQNTTLNGQTNTIVTSNPGQSNNGHNTYSLS